MKILCLFLLLIFNLNAQQELEWLNPLPVGTGLNDLDYVTPDICYAVGGPGLIIKTTDGGENWFILQSNTYEYLFSIDFVDEFTGIAVGRNGIILKTTDGGIKWENFSGITSYNLYDIEFVDKDICYAVGGKNYDSFENGNIIIKSTDKGSTWIKLLNEINQPVLYSVGIFNKNVAIAVGENFNILKTTNGGISWDELQGSIPNIEERIFWDVFFLSENDIIITGNEGILIKSSNGGLNWAQIQIGLVKPITSVLFIDSLTGFITSNTDILKTIDGGNTWESYYLFKDLVRKIDFINDSTALAVGIPGRIAKTTNRGLSWTIISKGIINRLNEIEFINNKIGFIMVEKAPMFLKTLDGGINWSAKPSPFFKDLTFKDEYSGWGIGNGGMRYSTTDGGDNWVSHYPLINESVYAGMDFYGNTGLIVGSEVLRTTDYGLSWQNLNYQNTFYDVHLYNENEAIAFGNKIIMKTTDGGVNWETKMNLPAEFILYDMSFTGDVGYIVSGFTTLKSTDRGETWSTLYNDNSKWLIGVSFLDENIGCFINIYDAYLTQDGGKSLYKVPTRAYGIYDVFIIDRFKGIIVGNMGAILKFNPSDIRITDVELFSNQVVENYSLTQNYPNPFNPNTIINYTIAKEGVSSLIVYDVLGREVSKLFDEYKAKGSYSIDFNASGLPSGIYFYQLKSDDFTSTKKMVVLK